MPTLRAGMDWPITMAVAGEAATVNPAAAARWAAALAEAGVGLLYARMPYAPDAEAVGVVRAMVAATADSRCRVLVRGRADLAVAAGAAGVHLPSAALPASVVRRLLPATALVGRSIHTREEAIDAARRAGCDYLMFGTVYPSASKLSGHPAAGCDALAAVCAAAALPVVAVGGITTARFGEVAAAGAAGVAAIGLFTPDRLPGAGAAVAAARSAFAGRPPHLAEHS